MLYNIIILNIIVHGCFKVIELGIVCLCCFTNILPVKTTGTKAKNSHLLTLTFDDLEEQKFKIFSELGASQTVQEQVAGVVEKCQRVSDIVRCCLSKAAVVDGRLF